MTATPARPTVPLRLETPTRKPGIRRYAAAAAVTLFVAVLTLPDLVGIDDASPFTQVVAFRPWALVGIAVAVGLLLLSMIKTRRAWPLTAGPLVVLLVGTAMVVPRAIADPLPTTGRPLTVLWFNAMVGKANADALGALVEVEKPDLVAVVEAGQDFPSRLSGVIQPGYRMASSTQLTRENSDPVTVAANLRLGEVTMVVNDDDSSYPFIEVSGGNLGALRFVAFHARSPRPGSVQSWQNDLALLPRWCAGPTPAIVAGDFNATLDHSLFRHTSAGCTDAADQRGAGLVPTWGPAGLKGRFGPQIDHVLMTGGIKAETLDFYDVPRSDHLAVLTRLRVPE